MTLATERNATHNRWRTQPPEERDLSATVTVTLDLAQAIDLYPGQNDDLRDADPRELAIEAIQDALDEAYREVLHKHGINLEFNPDEVVLK